MTRKKKGGKEAGIGSVWVWVESNRVIGHFLYILYWVWVVRRYV